MTEEWKTAHLRQLKSDCEKYRNRYYSLSDETRAEREALKDTMEFLRGLSVRRQPVSHECGFNQNNAVTQAAKEILAALAATQPDIKALTK